MKTPFAVSLAAAAALALVGFAASSLSARAEDAPPPPAADPAAAPDPGAAKMKALEAQVAALKAQVDYLRARDAAITSALLANEKASQNLHVGLTQAREAGFEAAAISANSRIAVLAALDALAGDLSSGVPRLTSKETELRRRADDLAAKAFPR